jgi:adenosylcobyric acid synthase
MTKLAKTLMVQGTASTVGKSTLVAGLCRIFAREGWHVAPFKAQNMALNSWVTRSGGEIGRAQVVQAEAAGIEPTVEMNPILLKPEGHSRSQVIVMGRPLASLEAQEYYRNRATLLPVVQQALHTLRLQYDLVIIEGAGSPVELNLAEKDLVNMAVAQLVEAPVLLVGDIDRGGIFASLLGTLILLPPADRARVKALIVNKFRGDLALWRDGEQMLASMGGIPVLGTVPFFQHIRIAEEDVVPLDEGTAPILQDNREATERKLDIVIVRFPYLSNYDEFDALAIEEQVRLHFVASPAEFPARPDLIILPGTKNTLSDLAWLWRQGLAQHIRRLAQNGSAVLGICGGYQMLGERVSDSAGSEADPGTTEPGLHLLPVETFFAPLDEKTTQHCHAQLVPAAARGLFAYVPPQSLRTYQIHVGRTIVAPSVETGTPSFLIAGVADGWLNADGWCAGAYLHGLFENDAFRHGVLRALFERRFAQPLEGEQTPFDRHQEYDKLADWLQRYLNIDQLKALCELA